MSKKHNEYKVQSLEDLLDIVTVENVDALCKDVSLWLKNYIAVIESIRASDSSGELKDMKNTQIAKGGFTWIDDGKNDLKGISVKFKESNDE